MQRWVSFILLLAFIRLQLVCCCGSVGICCETASPCVQASLRTANALSTCHCDHDHPAGEITDESHQDSDSQGFSDESNIDWETTSHNGNPHSQSHYFYLSEQNQSVLAERTDLRNVSTPIAYAILWSKLGHQWTGNDGTGMLLECRCPPKHEPRIFDLVGHLRI